MTAAAAAAFMRAGPSAAASALTRRRMTNAFSGSTSMRTPRDASAPSTMGPIAATRTRARPARSVASSPASVATCHRRSTCDALVNAIASTRPSPSASTSSLDRGLVAGRRVDVGRDRGDAGAGRLQEVDERPVRLLAVKLHADAAAAQIQPRQLVDHARRRRHRRRQGRRQPDVVQRARRLRTAGYRARAADGGDHLGADADPLGGREQAAQTFAGEQHQIVHAVGHERAQPRLDGALIGGVLDGDQRTAQRAPPPPPRAAAPDGRARASREERSCDPRVVPSRSVFYGKVPSPARTNPTWQRQQRPPSRARRRPRPHTITTTHDHDHAHDDPPAAAASEADVAKARDAARRHRTQRRVPVRLGEEIQEVSPGRRRAGDDRAARRRRTPRSWPRAAGGCSSSAAPAPPRRSSGGARRSTPACKTRASASAWRGCRRETPTARRRSWAPSSRPARARSRSCAPRAPRTPSASPRRSRTSAPRTRSAAWRTTRTASRTR